MAPSGLDATPLCLLVPKLAIMGGKLVVIGELCGLPTPNLSPRFVELDLTNCGRVRRRRRMV